MAREPNPTTPNKDEFRRSAVQIDNELQADPELAEGPASGGRITLFAVAVAAILGMVFYGLNNTSMTPSGTTPTAQTTQANPAPSNTAQTTQPSPGQTTGSAATTPPATAQSGSAPTQLAPPPTPPVNNGAPDTSAPSK